MDRIPPGLRNIHYTPPWKSFSAQQLFEMHQPRQAGAPTAEGRPLQGRLLREGAEKVKRKKEQTNSLGPSFLTCSQGTALDGNTDVQADVSDPKAYTQPFPAWSPGLGTWQLLQKSLLKTAPIPWQVEQRMTR